MAFLIFVFIILSGVKLGKVVNEYVYWQRTKDIYNVALIDAPIDYSYFKPFRNWEVGDLEDIEAGAAITLVSSTKENKNRVIFEKNASKILPIASLSKIMTAYIVIKNYNLEDTKIITQEIVNTEENKGQFSVGEEFTAKELLYSALVESSNDAARALEDIMGRKEFMNLMNSEAKEMGLSRTHFVDPIGLDPDFPDEGYNYSSAKEFALLVSHIILESQENPQLEQIFEIMRTQEHEILLSDGRFHHTAYNTNKLLDKFPDIIASKTGQTPRAGQCLLVVLPQPKGDGYIINIILNSNDRFGEMEKIINWLEHAFIW